MVIIIAKHVRKACDSKRFKYTQYAFKYPTEGSNHQAIK